MGRIARCLLVGDHTTNHVTFRSHNGTRIFDEETARHFLALLARHKARYGVLIHSYCLMGNHPHVVVTATKGQVAFSNFWKVVNHGLAWFVNRRNQSRGQVIMERMLSPTIQPDGRHLLTVMRYGDLNPVRAGIVKGPSQWKFSSYRHYAYGQRNPLIDDAPDYLALAESPAKRRLAYQSLFSQPLEAALMQKRTDLVRLPFIGAAEWVSAQLVRAGLVVVNVPDG